MSKYTEQVRFVCESMCNLDESTGASKVNEVIDGARGKIFEDYPIFNEDYRQILERKILRHYYTREICAESVGLWKLWLNNRMNEIMPYYNQLYQSALLEFNPFHDVDLTREHQGENSANTSGSTSGSANGRVENSGTNYNLFSDTPQGGLNGVRDENYLTTATKVTGTNNATNTNSTTSSTSTELSSADEFYEHVYGKQGTTSYAKLLKEFRDTFLNIDMLIIRDLNDLFMQVW